MSEPEPAVTASALIREIGVKLHGRGDEFVLNTGLSVPAGRTVGWIQANPGVMQREIAEISGTTPASVASMIKGLEAAGYVERRPDPHDVRVKRLYPLPKAKDLNANFNRLVETTETELLNTLDPDEQQTLLRLLTKVNERFR